MKIDIQPSVFRVFLLTFFVLLSLGQIQRVQLTPYIAIYLHEIVLACWLLTSSQQVFQQARTVLISNIKKNHFFWLFMLFFGTQTLTIQLIAQDLVSLLYVLRLVAYSGILLLFQVGFEKKWISIRQGAYILALHGLLLLVGGFIQYLLFPDTRWLLALGWDDHYYRMIGTLFDPGFLGLILTFFILFILSFKKWGIHPWFSHLVTLWLSWLSIVGIGLTFSRASYLACAAGIGVFCFVHRKLSPLLLIIVLFIVILLAPKPGGEGINLQRTFSISSRAESNFSALRSLQLTEVVIGRGLYRFTQQTAQLPQHANVPDNSFVTLFQSFGILGVFLLSAAVWQMRKVLVNSFVSPFSVALGVHSVFNNSLFYIWTLVWMIGCTAIWFHQQKNAV